MDKLVIIGASGHGKVCADIAEKSGYRDISFLDDDSQLRACAGYTVVGETADFRKYLKSADFFIAIGNSRIRQSIGEKVESAGGHLVTLIHPGAVIDKNVQIDAGTVVMAGVVINSETTVGKGGIINTSSSVDHDCRLGDYVHVAVGAHLAGTVCVGNHTWIGAGAIVSNNITICENCMIGAGAVVVRDIQVSGTYKGVPAKNEETIRE